MQPTCSSIRRDNDGDAYIIQNDKPSTGDVPLISIEYTFWEERLYKSTLKAEERSLCMQISDGLGTKYGSPLDLRSPSPSWHGVYDSLGERWLGVHPGLHMSTSGSGNAHTTTGCGACRFSERDPSWFGGIERRLTVAEAADSLVLRL
ncbi:MAG: hypothetical protein ACI8RZ_004398 [Myxococcota bacterium]|jgi:hypothetical protein